jgi:conjugative relaxase-like TrwC/TraI family protein
LARHAWEFLQTVTPEFFHAMLRINSSKTAQQAKSYYQQSDYYTKGKPSENQGKWSGQASSMLHLFGRVRVEDFHALIDNLHPITGARLTARNVPNRRPCYDFTFDVPKGVSLMHGLGKDERLQQAILEAATEAMAEMEQFVAVQTRDENGRKVKRVTGNWTWAPFLHETARPVAGIPEPHLHVHAVVLNATRDRVDQDWKALELRAIKDNAPYYQAAYHARLAKKLRELGYELEKKGKLFEIKGIPESLIRKFSSRDRVIRAEAKARGLTDPDEIAGLAALTREPKNASRLAQDELEAFWVARSTPAERTAVLEALERSKARVRSQVNLLTPSHTAERDALDVALRHCLERKSVVSENEVLAFALRHAVTQDVDPVRLRHLLEAEPRLIRSEVDGRRVLTTPEVIEEERALIRYVRSGHGTVRPLVHGHRIREERLSAEQRSAVLHVLESQDRVTGITGRAGVGKTTLLKEAVSAMERAGHRVVLLAPTAEAARDVLRKEGFQDADTVSALLTSQSLQERARGGVLLIDEAGLLSSRSMGQVFSLAEKINARVVLLGDTGQHHAVDRGDALALLVERAELKLTSVSTIRRQEGLYRQAVECLADGNVTGAFERFDDMGEIHEIDDASRHKVLADRYIEGVSRGKSVLIVAPTHAEIRQVTTAVRESLQAQGRLQRQKRVQTLRRVDLTEAERESPSSYLEGQVVQFIKSAKGIKAGQRLEVVEVRTEGVVGQDETGRKMLLDVGELAERLNVYEREVLPVAVGDRIRITQNGKTNGHRLSNGNLYTVTGFDKDGGLRLEGGMTVSPDWCHLTHGYCVSSHASQGKSVDEVLLSISEDSLVAASLEQFYVSASRGRHSLGIYTEDREALLESVQVSGRRCSALELIDRQPVEQIREQVLTPPEITPPPQPTPPPPLKYGLGTDPLPRPKLVEPLRQPKRRVKEQEMGMAY